MKTRTTLFAVLVALLILPLAATVYGQGTTAGNLTGTITGADGSPLPGVTVKVTSPALIGSRTTTSGPNGDYLLKNLTPGAYTVNFSMEGMATVERTATLELGGTARSDAKMEVATTTETISVTGEAPSILETTTSGLNLQADTFNALPIGRAPSTLADLSPGLTNNTPVAGQVTINGALAYDTAQLINGVNVMDPIFGNSNALYIEDAIAETQVMTSGISAEFGGFTGGVINTITKSGGNQFKGSARANLDKPNWRDETPFEKGKGITRDGDMNKNYEATLGGRIITDRLWFFAAGREFKQDTNRTLSVSGVPFVTSDKNPRYEIKLTGNITDNHSLQVSYIKNDRTLKNSTQLTPVDIRSIYANDKRPNDGLSAFYTGVLSNDLVAELRYSEKKFEFAGLGGTGKNLADSPFYSSGFVTGQGGVYNAPYFDATDPENRNNKEYAGSLSYFLSSAGAGSHDMKLGVDRTTITRTGGNSQSSTNEVYNTDYKVDAAGNPVLDANGRFIPLWVNQGDGTSLINTYLPTRGAKLDITTDALYFNDHWRLDNWTFNLGARYEKVRSKASGGINTVNTDTLVPRLGVSWDPWRNGAYKFDVTYAQYSGRYNPTIFGRNTPVGNPLGIYGYYVGPEGEGIGFAPGLDPANYVTYRVAAPTQNIFFNSGLKSPTANEISLSFGFRLPHNGAGKLTFVDRDTKNFIDDFVTLDTGCAEVVVQGVDAGCFDKIVYKNTDVPTRKYQGLQIQAQEQFTPNWMVAANWTYQIKNEGTYEGEGGQSIGTSAFGNRPEIYPLNRVQPNGNLANYQKHKGRLWTNYNIDMHAFGSIGIGAVVYYDSATTFSYTVTSAASTTQKQLNPGYKQTPNFTLFFGQRGVGSFNDTLYGDLAITYQVPVFKTLEPWIKLTIANVTNEDKLVTFNTGIRANTTGPKDAFGLPTTFTKTATFGKATGNGNYLVPREFLLALGIHF